MEDIMLGKIVKKLAELPGEKSGVILDLLEKLGGDDEKKRFESLKLLLRKSPQKAIEVLSAAELLLTDLGIEIYVSRQGRFVAKESFVGVEEFYSFDNDFEGLVSRWVEDEVKGAVLRVHELTEEAGDDQILKAAGGKRAIEITLGQLFQFIQDIRIRKTRKVYFAYIKGTNIVIHCRRGAGTGWDIRAESIDSSGKWSDGFCLVTHYVGD